MTRGLFLVRKNSQRTKRGSEVQELLGHTKNDVSRVSKLVSVVLPCHNAARFLASSLISILDQTYRNLEVICIDDGSTDETGDLLKSFAERDSRVRVVHCPENIGLIVALNLGIGQASGDYIARMDSDDISHPARFERQVKYLETHPEVGLCGCDVYRIADDNRLLGLGILPHSPDEVYQFRTVAAPFVHPTIMARAGIMKRASYDPRFPSAEDFELWLRLLAETKGANLKERLFYYRIWGGGISSAKRSEQESSVRRALVVHRAPAADPLMRLRVSWLKMPYVLAALKAPGLQIVHHSVTVFAICQLFRDGLRYQCELFLSRYTKSLGKEPWSRSLLRRSVPFWRDRKLPVGRGGDSKSLGD